MFVDSTHQRVERLEYFDINDELNRVVFTSEQFDSVCKDSIFIPAFPDSAERIRLR